MTVSTTLDLPFQAPFAPEPLLAALDAHAVPGVEVTDVVAGTHRRRLVLGGEPVPVTVHLDREAVTLTVGTSDPGRVAQAVAVARQWFDLDADPERVAVTLRDDPVVGPLVTRRPGLRVLGHPVGFEAAVSTVLGQQVSVAAARTFASRLVAAYGVPAAGDGGLGLFPVAEALAGSTPAELQAAVGLTHARARTVHGLAEACAAGLRITADGDRVETRRQLRALPGIGPWTVEYLALRALGDRDAYPAGDLVVRRALGVTTEHAARTAALTWSPYRAYAAFHLWTDLAYAGGGQTGSRPRPPVRGARTARPPER